ncbi:hypothetical protein [Streptomyces sp. CA-146814]|uniref:NHL repeat-containing protein n=1 Tax=Streptomyces sp. CA-146814 TaxID=3240053 RepID=UPI003D8FC0D0
MTQTNPGTASYRDGTLVTVAGNGEKGYALDRGSALEAKLNQPRSVMVDEQGNIYITDYGNACIRKVTPEGTISPLVGQGLRGTTITDLPCPYDTAKDEAGNLYIAAAGYVYKVEPDGTAYFFAGKGKYFEYNNDGGDAINSRFDTVEAVAVDGDGIVYIASRDVRKVTQDGKIHAFAGTSAGDSIGDDGPALRARLASPRGMAVDEHGNLYIADSGNNRIRKVAPDGTITTVAGNGTPGYNGDNRNALDAWLNNPHSVAVDAAGNLYIADTDNHRVRKVTPDGIINTIAGNGHGGYNGDGAEAVHISLHEPVAVALAPSGDLYIADRANHRVRKLVGASSLHPPTPPAADLYGKFVLPVTAPRGEEFEIGARVHNRGPATADGQDVTVVLTLAGGLKSTQADNGRLARTFTGTELAPNSASLDGVFRVRAAEDAAPGVYESTLEIQYGGDLNIKDNTAVLPVTVVVPEPVGGEIDLIVYQDNLPKAAPGEKARFHLRLLAPIGQPVNPGVLDHRFTAPTGFVFIGRPTYTYPNTALGAVHGDLDHKVQDDGRTLLIRANPHLNTTETDAAPLLYTLDLCALDDAAPGLSSNGSASIGRRSPVQIRAEVTTNSAKPSISIVQTKLDEAHITPGEGESYPVSLKLTNTGQNRTGAHDVVFTAPEGLCFFADRATMWRGEQDDQVELAAERSNDNRTLTIRNAAALNLNPGQWSSLYPAMEAEPNATPGTVRVNIRIGDPTFASSHANVTIKRP